MAITTIKKGRFTVTTDTKSASKKNVKFAETKTVKQGRFTVTAPIIAQPALATSWVPKFPIEVPKQSSPLSKITVPKQPSPRGNITLPKHPSPVQSSSTKSNSHDKQRTQKGRFTITHVEMKPSPKPIKKGRFTIKTE